MAGPTDDQGYLIDPVDGDRIGSLALDIAFGPNRGPPRPPFERSEPTRRGNAVNASRAGQVAIYHTMDPEGCPAHRDSPSSADESDICESLLRKTCVAAARAAGYMGFDPEEIHGYYHFMCESLEQQYGEDGINRILEERHGGGRSRRPRGGGYSHLH